MIESAPHSCRICGAAIDQNQPGAPEQSDICSNACRHMAKVLDQLPPDRARTMLEEARRQGLLSRAADSGESTARAATQPEAIRTDRFAVEGYFCPSCAWLVGESLKMQSGVLEAQADFLSDSVAITFDMSRTGPDDLRAQVAKLGYGLNPLGEESTAEEQRFSKLLSRFVFSLFLAFNVMALSAVHWASYLQLIPDVDLQIISVIQLILTLPLIALGVWPLLRRAVRLLRLGRASMDLLFVMGFSAAFGLSIAAFFNSAAESRFYFDTCAAFVAISLFGRLVEGKLRMRAAQELRGLMQVTASKVAVCPGGTLDEPGQYQPVDQVEPGQIIRVEPDEVVAFDGEMALDLGLVSEAMLSGEPTPQAKHEGDSIWAGSLAVGQAILVRVTRPYREGRIRDIADAIAQTLTASEMNLRVADRLAAWFVPAVLLTAALTFVIRAWLLDAGFASESVWMPTVSVLLIACPCAFGIATAAALAVAVANLLPGGVLVKDARALERFGAVDCLLLDKTGTLTTGIWKVRQVRWFGPQEEQRLAQLAGAEAGLEHPLAYALTAYLHQQGIQPEKPGAAVELVPGRGLRASFPSGELNVGSAELFQNVAQTDDLPHDATVVYFGSPARAEGCFLLADSVRPTAPDSLSFFREQGVEVQILSGDRQSVVDAVAQRLGIAAARGGLTPEDKQAHVQKLMGQGRKVAFAGDGSNDAPAMAEADVAISLRHGTDLSLSTAHVLPLSGDLDTLPLIRRAAQVSHKIIWQNFSWAFAYNLLFLPLAALGWLHPIFAAGLMFASSITVLLNSMRLRPRIRNLISQAVEGSPKASLSSVAESSPRG